MEPGISGIFMMILNLLRFWPREGQFSLGGRSSIHCLWSLHPPLITGSEGQNPPHCTHINNTKICPSYTWSGAGGPSHNSHGILNNVLLYILWSLAIWVMGTRVLQPNNPSFIIEVSRIPASLLYTWLNLEKWFVYHPSGVLKSQSHLWWLNLQKHQHNSTRAPGGKVGAVHKSRGLQKWHLHVP